jgi:3-oxoacyl-(acyl-carrier-protein) synthase
LRTGRRELTKSLIGHLIAGTGAVEAALRPGGHGILPVNANLVGGTECDLDFVRDQPRFDGSVAM